MDRLCRMMQWQVRDFELIFDHLFAAYSDLGDHPDEALERAAGRIRELRLSISG